MGLCAAASSKGWCPWLRQGCGGNTEAEDPSFLRVPPTPSHGHPGLGGAGVGRLQETGVEGTRTRQGESSYLLGLVDAVLKALTF